MDYIEAFKNLKTNNKYSRKSPHKAILLLTIIEMYETNALSENMIPYDDKLKCTFQKVWERTLRDEPIFHPELFFPFWYMQNEDFWHIVPNRGQENILVLLRDSHVKPSEAKLKDCVRYAELDEDLYFLMTLPSGRSSLKRALLETYTTLTEKQIDLLAQSADNSIDYSVSALSEYERILSQGKDESKAKIADAESELVQQFQKFNEDIQILINFQYFSFLKSHREEREMFKEICPTVYDLLDKIVNHPVKQGDIRPSFAFTYDNFLSDMKIALMSEDGSMELIDKIGEAIDVLRGNSESFEDNQQTKDPIIERNQVERRLESIKDNQGESTINIQNDSIEEEVEHVYLDSNGKVLYTLTSSSKANQEKDHDTKSRKGMPWTNEEEEQIGELYHQGKDTQEIATTMGRTEVAIKARLAKLGLIDYVYSQEDASTSNIDLIQSGNTQVKDYSIENSFTKCYILNKDGEKVFSAEGKLKYINGNLYRLNLKPQCFTIKIMRYDGNIWLKGEKKIVAYPQTALFRTMDSSIDYCEDVEGILDSPVFENCKVKVKGIWYKYNGDLLSDNITPNEQVNETLKKNRERLLTVKGALYAVRRQAILRAMSFFRKPASIRDITRTISRTAWGATIEEEEVEKIINTMSEIESEEGKYILLSITKKNDTSLSSRPVEENSSGLLLNPKKTTRVRVGCWLQWNPTGVVGKVIGFKYSGGLQKIVLKIKSGPTVEVYDNPKAYEIILY